MLLGNISTSPFPYKWMLKDALFEKNKGKVFSCFSGGGGSSLGYKLAGFDVVGCLEIDLKMTDIYRTNLQPKYCYNMAIQDFIQQNDFPDELLNLDILDGSPPCSTFSVSGNRESDWGKMRTFKEGGKKQILDTLFFDFLDLASILQPKIIVAENVPGLLIGNAKKYVCKIYEKAKEVGYKLIHFVLDAQHMGVPQKRKRVFFIGIKKTLGLLFLERINLFEYKPFLNLNFLYKPIYFSEIFHDYQDAVLPNSLLNLWPYRKNTDKSFADINQRINQKRSFFNHQFIKFSSIPPTILASNKHVLYDYCRLMNKTELCLSGSWPLDYDFKNVKPVYVIGMSVPPVMMANIANQIYHQWIAKL